ncbi:hypothetical protein [Bradyrhizobium liaoningense]
MRAVTGDTGDQPDFQAGKRRRFCLIAALSRPARWQQSSRSPLSSSPAVSASVRIMPVCSKRSALFAHRSIYDLGPTSERLRQLIDFGRLNGGDPRITICATHLESRRCRAAGVLIIR